MIHRHRQRQTTVHTRCVPENLKAQFKSWCARRDYSMQDAIVALMYKALDEDKPLPRARKTEN